MEGSVRLLNRCPTLSGLCDLQDALVRMDGALLSVEHLAALARAVPEDDERAQIAAFLQVTGLAPWFPQAVLGVPAPQAWRCCHLTQHWDGQLRGLVEIRLLL